MDYDQPSYWFIEAEEMLSTIGVHDVSQWEGKRVLELGAARCLISRYCKMQDVGCETLSVDRETYEHADGKLEEIEWGRQQVPYVKADARALPLESDSFDVVVSYEGPPAVGIRSLDDLRAVITEVRRVLKPSGTFLLTPPGLMDKYFNAIHIDPAAKREFFIAHPEICRRILRKSRDMLCELLPGAEILDEGGLYEYLQWQKPENGHARKNGQTV